MDRQVYNYRSGGFYFLIGFLTLWTSGWMYFGLAALWSGPTVRINGQNVSHSDAMPIYIGLLAFGCVMVGVTVFAWLYCLNSRVEISNGEILWFDWMGKIRVQSPLKGSKLLPVAFSSKKAQIQTENGIITVKIYINDFGSLTSRLSDGTDGKEREQSPPIPFDALPEDRTFSYRGSPLHLFSFVWLGLISYMAFQDSQSKQRDEIIFYVFFAAFASIGIWMQLTGWIEKIQLSPDGLVWTDCLGRTRVRARLEEIVSVNKTMSGNSSSFQIATKVGTVSFSSYLRGYSDLVDSVQAIVEGAKASSD